MQTLKEVLKDKLANTFIVGVVLGFSTLSFINNVGSMIINQALHTTNGPFVWKNFWGYTILYGSSVIAVVIIRRFAEK